MRVQRTPTKTDAKRPAPAREAGEKLFYALIYQVFDWLRWVCRCCLALELGSRHEEALANARGSGTDEGSLGWGGLLVRDECWAVVVLHVLGVLGSLVLDCSPVNYCVRQFSSVDFG